jgi:hypothetical protein
VRPFVDYGTHAPSDCRVRYDLLGTRRRRARVTIGFIAYHKAVPVIDFRYLGAPVELIVA